MMSSSLPGVPINTLAPCVVNLAMSDTTSLQAEAESCALQLILDAGGENFAISICRSADQTALRGSALLTTT